MSWNAGVPSAEMLLSDMVGVSHEVYAKVDVFAFGVTAFFMCVGRELFSDDEWTSSPNKPEAEAKVERRAYGVLEEIRSRRRRGGRGRGRERRGGVGIDAEVRGHEHDARAREMVWRNVRPNAAAR